MTALPSDSQLSNFSTIKTILQTSSVLNGKFTTNDYYEYEPKHKSSSFKGFPYIVIKTPDTKTDLFVLSHETQLKTFTAEIILRVEYLARSNLKTYANAIIKAIESSESTFISNGMYNPKLDVVGTDDQQVIEEKELVEITFDLDYQAYMAR